MSAAKIVVDQLIKDLQDRPDDFKCGEHTLDDDKTGYKYWIANLACQSGVYMPSRLSFGFFNGRRFHKALDNWKASQNIKACTARLGAKRA